MNAGAIEVRRYINRAPLGSINENVKSSPNPLSFANPGDNQDLVLTQMTDLGSEIGCPFSIEFFYNFARIKTDKRSCCSIVVSAEPGTHALFSIEYREACTHSD